MKVSEITVNAADFANISVEQLQPRSAGLHVSSIIRHIIVTSGLAKDGNFNEDDLELFAIIGRLWEQMLADVMFKPPRYQRPGEIELDGIYGSPDAVDTDDCCLAEYKVTWLSSNRSIESFFKYMLQVKAYCHMLGLTRVKLYVCFVCGNYRPPVPQFKAWQIDFSPHELKDCWRMLLANGKEIQS